MLKFYQVRLDDEDHELIPISAKSAMEAAEIYVEAVIEKRVQLDMKTMAWVNAIRVEEFRTKEATARGVLREDGHQTFDLDRMEIWEHYLEEVGEECLEEQSPTA